MKVMTRNVLIDNLRMIKAYKHDEIGQEMKCERSHVTWGSRYIIFVHGETGRNQAAARFLCISGPYLKEPNEKTTEEENGSKERSIRYESVKQDRRCVRNAYEVRDRVILID